METGFFRQIGFSNHRYFRSRVRDSDQHVFERILRYRPEVELSGIGRNEPFFGWFGLKSLENVEPASGYASFFKPGLFVGRIHQGFLDLLASPVRVEGLNQGIGSGYVWGCHGRSAVSGVTVTWNGAVNVYSGSEKVDALFSVAGRACLVASVVMRANRNHVVQVIGSGVTWAGVVVAVVVAGGGNEANSLFPGFFNRPFEGSGRTSASPGVGSEVDPDLRCVGHGFDSVGRRATSRSGKKFDSDHGYVPSHPDHAFSIVSNSTDRTCAVGAVGVVVIRVVVVVYEIPSVDVVYKTIPVVVFSVSCDFARIGPHVRFQIFMVAVYAGVNDRA